MAYWRDFPPTHVLVRALAVGIGVYKPDKTVGGAEEMSDGELRSMFK